MQYIPTKVSHFLKTLQIKDSNSHSLQYRLKQNHLERSLTGRAIRYIFCLYTR